MLYILKRGFLNFTELVRETPFSRSTIARGIRRLEAKDRLKTFPVWALEGTSGSGKRTLRRGRRYKLLKFETPKGKLVPHLASQDDKVMFNYIRKYIRRKDPQLAGEMQHLWDHNNMRSRFWRAKTTQRIIKEAAESYLKLTMGDFSSKRKYYGMSIGFKPVTTKSDK